MLYDENKLISFLYVSISFSLLASALLQLSIVPYLRQNNVMVEREWPAFKICKSFSPLNLVKLSSPVKLSVKELAKIAKPVPIELLSGVTEISDGKRDIVQILPLSELHSA
jgi:hypothetical protein